MSDFAGMQDLLQDFLVEAEDLLSGVDNKLVELERNPEDRALLNEIFRGFHTIKGGAGFLGAQELVTLCHLTENLFDKLRNGELHLSPALMDVILEATAAVREMFGYLERSIQPPPADPQLLERLRLAIAGKLEQGTLQKMGVRYVGAVNGRIAWENLEKAAERAKITGRPITDFVSAVITDIEMPEMDGFILTKKIKSDRRFTGVPVLMHSSLSGMQNQYLGKSVGVDEYVPKFHPRELAETLQRLFAKRQETAKEG